MAKKHIQFDDFIQLYEAMVRPLKQLHPGWEQLDGKDRPTQTAFAQFQYKGKLWKIDADTRIKKLDVAYDALLSKKDPFIIQPTQGNKNKCLILSGEKSAKKYFYVYLLSELTKDK